jgi:hypothetical protein
MRLTKVRNISVRPSLYTQHQACQTRGPRATCGPLRCFMLTDSEREWDGYSTCEFTSKYDIGLPFKGERVCVHQVRKVRCLLPGVNK